MENDVLICPWEYWKLERDFMASTIKNSREFQKAKKYGPNPKNKFSAAYFKLDIDQSGMIPDFFKLEYGHLPIRQATKAG